MPPKPNEPVEESTVEPIVESEIVEETPVPVEKKSDIQKLTEVVEAQSEQIKILTKAADKTQLARHTPKDTIGRSVKVATIEGKLVESWELLSNIATYRKGEEKVDQRGEFTLEDGTKVPYKIEEFRDLIDPVSVEVNLEKTKFDFDIKGNRRGWKTVSFLWKGEEKMISSTFINP